MGTRCNVIVIGKGFQVVLYRHWDGYPAETGAALLSSLEARNAAEAADGFGAAALVRHLLSQGEDGRKDFEITDALHGDIEHVYQIHWPDGNGSALVIKHAAVDSEAQIDNWRDYARAYSLETFRAMVNRERAAVNLRIDAMRRAGAAHLKDAEEYQPV